MSKKARKQASWKQKQLNFKNNVGHVFNRKVLHWSYCSGCGLVALKNATTRDAMREPCKSMET